jgi:hypothetical protein
VPLKLGERFTDADGDLVADAPKDAKEIRGSADDLNFSYVATNEPDLVRERFKEFVVTSVGRAKEGPGRVHPTTRRRRELARACSTASFTSRASTPATSPAR